MEVPSLSLLELNRLIKNTLRENLGQPFWIVAEILELHVNRSGHCYLELIDKEEKGDQIMARAKGTIWANQFSMLRPFFETSTGIRLNSGIRILFKAVVEYHELYGLSLNITDIDPAYTLGDLARKKQEVIRKLNEQGVFNMNRELEMPPVLQHIAVISSTTAAGYGDFMESLEQNSFGYAFRTILFPAIMQGDQAASSIVQAFEDIFDREQEFDCVVLIRGGGSQSDLECFNNYDLSYHITQFPLPVLTGIGHERDESVADMVAARQLKTPTAVAEFLIDRMLSFEMLLNGFSDRMQSVVNTRVRNNLLMLQQLKSSLVSNSRHLVKNRYEKINYLEKSFIRAVHQFLQREKERNLSMEKIVELVRPETILARGYSITKANGRAIKDISSLENGQEIETILHNGLVESTVNTLKKKS